MKKMKRINQNNTAALADSNAFEKLVDQIAATQLVIEDIKTTHNREKQEREKSFKAKVARLEAKLTEQFAIATMYANQNREELLGTGKSRKLRRATFGFRKASGALKFLKGWTETRIITALHKSLLSGQCVKTIERLDKTAAKNSLSPAQLEQHGMYLDTADKFYIDPQRDEPVKSERIAS